MLGKIYPKDRFEVLDKELTEINSKIFTLFERLAMTLSNHLGLNSFALNIKNTDSLSKNFNEAYAERIKSGLGIFSTHDDGVGCPGSRVGLDADFYYCANLQHPIYDSCSIMYDYRSISSEFISIPERKKLEEFLTAHFVSNKMIVATTMKYFDGDLRQEANAQDSVFFEWHPLKTTNISATDKSRAQGNVNRGDVLVVKPNA